MSTHYYCDDCQHLLYRDAGCGIPKCKLRRRLEFRCPDDMYDEMRNDMGWHLKGELCSGCPEFAEVLPVPIPSKGVPAFCLGHIGHVPILRVLDGAKPGPVTLAKIMGWAER